MGGKLNYIQPRVLAAPRRPEIPIATDLRLLLPYRSHDDICERIRAKDGFKNFLELPTEYEMNAAAGQGTIVVVNLSSARSDAFLINRRSDR